MSKSSGNRNNGEDAFREWLSDHLRYLVLLIALLLAVVVIIMAVSLLDSRPGSSDTGTGDKPDAVVIMSETAVESGDVSQSEAVSEPDTGEKSETEKKEADLQTEEKAEPLTEAKEEAETEKKAEPLTEAKEEAGTEEKAEPLTEAKEEAETEKKAEPVTEAKEEAETEEKAEPLTEAKEESETEEKAEPLTEAREESETEEKAEPVTEAKVETGSKAKKETESETETEAETESEAETETETESETEKNNTKKTSSGQQSEEEKPAGKSAKNTGKTTTSSTEKTVNAPLDSRKTEAAALAGFGAETEKESTDSGTITVTSTAPVKRVTALISGGSSSTGNRVSVTNIDTGTTIGTYHNSGSSLNPAGGTSSGPVGTSDQGSDADNSGGLVSVEGTTDQNWDSYDGSGGNDIEIVGQETPETAPSPTYRTISSACNIRSYPDYGDNVIGGLGGGETVLFYGEEAGWYKIEYNGIVGYIGPRFLQ